MGIGDLFKRRIPDEVEQRMAEAVKPVGSMGYDPWGYSEETTKKNLAIAHWLYKNYFRVRTVGIENVPAKGRLVVVANHAGQFIPADGLMLYTALALNPHGPRLVRGMVERIFPKSPFVGNMVNRTGNVLGDPLNCRKMLEREEAVMVFPEGERGAIKAWKYRYQLQRMGTGFVRMAIENNAPIVPVGVIGVEEMSPGLGRFKAFGEMMGTPPLPLALPLALPVRIHLYFGKPMHLKADLHSEEEMRARVEEVRDAMNGLIQQGLSEREGVFK